MIPTDFMAVHEKEKNHGFLIIDLNGKESFITYRRGAWTTKE
jgi:hypothetical protein